MIKNMEDGLYMDVAQIICPNCGAKLEFKADSQKLHCDYCLSDFTNNEIKVVQNDDNNIKTTIPNQSMQEEFNSHTNLYTCDSCGAEIISDENTAATFCHYCHSPVTLMGRVTGDCRPEFILPFKFTREHAESEFHKWCKKKWFLPNSFKSERQLEKMTGLYVPFWLADCTVNGKLSAEGKIIHSYTSGDYRVTNTKIYNVERGAYLDYLGIPADGAQKLDDELMDAVEPFDYTELQSFSMTYLPGFFADKYDVSKSAVLPRIKKRIENDVIQILKNDMIGYSAVNIKDKYINILNTTWHYVMLPVWFMTYKHNGKNYFFALNGQTGKVSGLPPLSKTKATIFASLMFAIFGTLAFIIGGFIV